MDRLSKLFDFTLDHVVGPSLNWVIDHPIITVAVIVALVVWSMRGYRML